jgi:hypothetical protein
MRLEEIEQMRKRVLRTGIFLFVAAAAPLSSDAQTTSDDPRFVAASWVLNLEEGIPAVIAKMGGDIVFDTAQGTASALIDRAPLASPEIRTRVELAAALGVRTGTLSDHLRCEGFPTAEQIRAFGAIRPCRLLGGVSAIIQVDPPQATEAGVTVNVLTATSWRHSHPDMDDAFSVTRIFRQLLLKRTPTGDWEVDRVLRKAITH